MNTPESYSKKTEPESRMGFNFSSDEDQSDGHRRDQNRRNNAKYNSAKLFPSPRAQEMVE